MTMTYTVREYGGFWIVSDDRGEITRYRTDEVRGYDGAVDLDELRATVAEDLCVPRGRIRILD